METLKIKTVKILKQHIVQAHTKSASFECSKCPKKFNKKFNRDRHQLNHLEDVVDEEALARAVERARRRCDGDRLQEGGDASVEDHDEVAGQRGDKPDDSDVGDVSIAVIGGPEPDSGHEILEAEVQSGDQPEQGEDDSGADLAAVVTARNEIIANNAVKYLEICRKQGDSEGELAKKRDIMMSRLITSQSPFIPRTKPATAKSPLSTSSSKSTWVDLTSPSAEEVEEPLAGHDQVRRTVM